MDRWLPGASDGELLAKEYEVTLGKINALCILTVAWSIRVRQNSLN